MDGNAEDNILFKVYMRESGLKIDFLMRYKGQITLVEVKSTTGNIKSTKTILKNKNVYHVNSAIKLGKYNVAPSSWASTMSDVMERR